jgi:ribosomal protein L3 glutamine methyltransferase
MTLPLNLQQAIDEVAAQLGQANISLGQGTLSVTDEAAWLVLAALEQPLDADDQELQASITPRQWQRVQDWVQRRIHERIPTAYLSGEAWLQGVPFTVDSRTIIPRSLIAEVLAMGLLDPHVPETSARVMDLCTGNGSLAVLCAMAWPQAHVDALDISVDALAVARINVQRHGLSDRMTLLASDGLAAARGLYDLVVCNPPYVNQDSMAQLPPEFLHEPTLALAGGTDGMDFIRPMLHTVRHHLQPHGALVLELGHEIGHFLQAFPQLGGTWLPTSAGDEQVVLLTAQDLAGLQP